MERFLGFGDEGALAAGTAALAAEGAAAVRGALLPAVPAGDADGD